MNQKLKIEVEVSSGNVFADLGLPNADEQLAKVRLAMLIQRAIKARRLPQAAAADIWGVSQPKVSALVNYDLNGFSVERLMNFLNALGHDVEIVVHRGRRTRKPDRTSVLAA